MSKSPLETVLTLAKRRETEVAQRLHQAEINLETARSQLRQIHTYRQDYHRLATGGDKGCVDSNQLQTARYFLAQLDEAASRQERQVQQAELLAEQQRQAWIEAQRHRKAIKDLKDLRHREQALLDDKRQQQVLDDAFGVRVLFSGAGA
jgi:flagellar export protein FliJ